MRSRYYVREKERALFITSTVVDWLPLFTSPACCDLFAGSLGYCQREKGLRLCAWSSWTTTSTLSSKPTISRA